MCFINPDTLMTLFKSFVYEFILLRRVPKTAVEKSGLLVLLHVGGPGTVLVNPLATLQGNANLVPLQVLNRRLVRTISFDP